MKMSVGETIRGWARLFYFLGQNPLTPAGAVLTTSGAATLIAFWFYDFLLPGPPHPYMGILLFLILPVVFVLGLVLIPIGILLHRRRLSSGELLEIYPEINLQQPMGAAGAALRRDRHFSLEQPHIAPWPTWIPLNSAVKLVTK